jgi:hypothetical protein
MSSPRCGPPDHLPSQATTMRCWSAEMLVSARGVDEQSYVVLVVAPLEVQTDTLRAVGLLLLAAAPLLVALVAVAVWVLVGQSLRTVERIRRQVAEIDGRRLHERVEVPPTGTRSLRWLPR